MIGGGSGRNPRLGMALVARSVGWSVKEYAASRSRSRPPSRSPPASEWDLASALDHLYARVAPHTPARAALAVGVMGA